MQNANRIYKIQIFIIFIFFMSNIKFFAFAKYSGSVPIYSICPDAQSEQDLKVQVAKVLSQAKNLNLRPQQRQKFNTKKGCWFCKKDSKDIIYVILCSTNYPERHAFAAINLLKQHLQKLGAYDSQPQSSLKIHAKGQMQEICKKYQNLRNVDKIAIANQNVEELRTSVSENTRKMLDNQVQLQDLQKKSQTLKDHANQFKESAGQLQKLMFWRNCKLKILIALAIVALICIIVIPIAIKVKS